MSLEVEIFLKEEERFGFDGSICAMLVLVNYGIFGFVLYYSMVGEVRGKALSG